MNYDSTGLSHIDTIRHIAQEEEPLYPTYCRMVRVDELPEIWSDLYKSLRKWESGTSLYDTIFEDTESLPFLLKQSKSDRRKSWIYTKDDHILSIVNQENNQVFLSLEYFMKYSLSIIISDEYFSYRFHIWERYFLLVSLLREYLSLHKLRKGNEKVIRNQNI